MKKKFKGSPGPWEMKGLSVYSADGNEVMTAYDRDDRVLLAANLDIADANLYLTAAAPELLEALQDVVEAWEKGMITFCGAFANEPIYLRAKEAIEKALGE